MRLTREQLAQDLVAVGGGDVTAFIRVYHATSRKLYGIIVRILGRADLSDEVLQEVYIRVWQRAADFDTTKASPITWLACIARNRALDEIRRKHMSSISDVPDLLELPSDEDIQAEHLEDEELRRLHECFEELEPAHREVMQKVYFEGMTRNHVAEHLGQSIFMVRKWMQVALVQLKGMS